MEFLKKYPVSISGLILALFALGILLQDVIPVLSLACGVIGLLLYVIYLLKLAVLNVKLKEPLDNHVTASMLPAFTMATMLLAGYIKPFNAALGVYIWYAGLLAHALLIVWFSLKFLKNFNINKVLPSWFVVYVGIAAASMSADAAGRLDVGQAAFWFAFVSYFILLIAVCYRVFIIKEIPEAVQPVNVIFAAPASLLLAGYAVSFPEKNALIMGVLLACSVLLYILGIVYFLKLCWGNFMPNFSAFTFPLVISAIAVKMSVNYFKEVAWLADFCNFQTVIAALAVSFVLIGYFKFLFSD